MTVSALCLPTAGKSTAPGLGLINAPCTEVAQLEIKCWGWGGFGERGGHTHLTPELNQLSLLAVKTLAIRRSAAGATLCRPISAAWRCCLHLFGLARNPGGWGAGISKKQWKHSQFLPASVNFCEMNFQGWQRWPPATRSCTGSPSPLQVLSTAAWLQHPKSYQGFCEQRGGTTLSRAKSITMVLVARRECG